MARSSLLPWGFSFYFVLVVLVVPIICQTPPGPPVITGPTVIKNGDSVTITCSSTGGDPTPTVKWIRDNVVLDATSTTSGGVTVNEYTFTASPAEHLGVFECRTDNGVLQNPLTSTLFVIVVNTSPQTPTLTGTTNPAPNQQSTWTCTSTGGYPAPTMTMRIGRNQFSTNEFTTTSVSTDGTKSYTVTGTLKWSPTIGNNGQTLFCDVAHPITLNTPQTVSLPLTVISLLAISASPTFYNPTIGTSVTLNCVVTSGTATSITWLKDNNIININADTRLTNGDVSTPSLSISNVQQSDRGSYVCRAVDATGTIVNSNTITVTPQAVLSISISPPSALVIQGTNEQIVCTVQGTPAAQSISWTRNGVSMAIDNSKYTGGNTANPSLTINNFQSSDAGNYVCSATNAAGTSTSGVCSLTYGEYPSIVVAPTTGSADIGTNSYVITCTVTATPVTTSWWWTKTPIGGGTPVTINQGMNTNKYVVTNNAASPSLTIKIIESSDEANYVCRATNTAGTRSSSNAQLTVTGGALSVSVTPATQSAVIGDNIVVIQCTVSGIPHATSWYWTFSPLGSGSGSQTTITQGTNNADYTVSNSNTNPHLTIKTITTADAGDYICRATNIVGTSSSTQSRLTVAVLSISISPPSALVIQGTNQQIVCTVQGTPAAQSISWTRSGVSIAIDNSKYTGGNTANPSLTINNFQSSDAGNYVCSATNAAGTSTSGVSSLTYGAITESASSDLYVDVIGGLVGVILILMVTVGILLFKRKKALADGKQNTNMTGTETTPSSANPITSEVYDYIREDTHDERNRDPGTGRVEHVSSTPYEMLGMKDPPNTYSDLSSQQGMPDGRNYTMSNSSTKSYETLGEREESTHKYTDLTNYQDPKEAEYIDTQM